MKKTAAALEGLINQNRIPLQSIPEDKMRSKPAPHKWSKKEILGHLVDSAENNIRRFIAARYEESPFIVYNQDKWVSVNNYQEWRVNDIIELWYLLNKQVVAIWENTPSGTEQRSCLTEELHTIDWLANDYIKHLKHHLHQVLELEPVAYP